MNYNKWLIVIPARLASQRLANKPLQSIAGKALIIRVYENIKILKSKGAEVTVATDSEEILSLCQNEAIACQMTSQEHKSGTDRCLEVALKSKHPFIMNVQGDEPFLSIEDLTALAKSLENNTKAHLATLCHPKLDKSELNCPNTVKVISDERNFALNFSRIAKNDSLEKTSSLQNKHRKHIGVYAYRRQSLIDFCSFSVAESEARERLEQLRALENKMNILLVEAQHNSLGIDTLKDLKMAQEIFTKA